MFGAVWLLFVAGSCCGCSSFETIEHHDKHEEMMREIKQVLKPDGVLIISSSNQLTYSDEPKYSNPFHISKNST
jgi:hypothetical protein